MSYKLSKLPFGTSKPEKLFDIDTDFTITGMCHIEKFGFLFLFRDNHFIAHFDYKGKASLPWMGIVNEKGDHDGEFSLCSSPSSICYYPAMKRCFLLEAGGSKIRFIDIESKYCGGITLSPDFQRYFSKVLSVDKIETACDVDKYGNLYWTVKDLHRCFKKERDDNRIINYVGNGRSGFAVSNDMNSCLLSNPSGIKCVENLVYISDGANHCIRKVNGNIISIAAGNPTNEQILSFPSQIVHNNGIMYVLDKTHIKYLALKDLIDTGTIYTSPNIVAIEGNIKKDIYVLESYEKKDRRD